MAQRSEVGPVVTSRAGRTQPVDVVYVSGPVEAARLVLAYGIGTKELEPELAPLSVVALGACAVSLGLVVAKVILGVLLAEPLVSQLRTATLGTDRDVSTLASQSSSLPKWS